MRRWIWDDNLIYVFGIFFTLVTSGVRAQFTVHTLGVRPFQ